MNDEPNRGEIERVVNNFWTLHDFRRATKNWPLSWFEFAADRAHTSHSIEVRSRMPQIVEAVRRERIEELNRQAADRAADSIRQAFTEGTAAIQSAVKDSARPNAFVRWGFVVMVLTLIAAAIAAWPVLREFLE